MKKIKVVSAKSMIKMEGLAYAQGYHELEFMEAAGNSIAELTETFVKASQISRVVTLLVGKGNNGGDAYVAGRKLLEKGFQVKAFHLYHIEKCGPLCCSQKEKFEQAGGFISFIYDEDKISFGQEGVILDGLVGTGFKGKAEGELLDIISKANASTLPILAIDIPSGVCGDTGSVGSSAIKATATIYLELPKLGFFLKEGWDHVGKLMQGKFGLPAIFLDQIEPEAFLVEEVESLPVLERSQNKYDAGYVLTVAGSLSMVGAGILSSYAALRSGAGIVRWFYPREIEELIVSAPWEIIKEPFIDEYCFSKELDRARALIIGPGMGREKSEGKKIKKILSRCRIPSVIDADALFYLAKHPSCNIPAKALLTPHKGELKRLLEAHSLLEKGFLSGCQAFVRKKKMTLLVKGAPNFLFSEDAIPHILPFGNPGMATAGSGDVLSGVVAALLAQGMPVHQAASLGCYLHGKAGDIAAEEKTPFCMTASDILHYLPQAFASFLKKGRE